jgi:DNA-directed RNA polymerase specialized sigma24 family protein
VKTSDTELLAEISNKLSVLIALSIRFNSVEKLLEAGDRSKRGVGELVRYLDGMGLSAPDISRITGSPVTSVRTLLTPGRKK